ncbi:MAG: ComEC/Rec2 family competence protein [Chloroflexi bacterium]|nr:ComEC/Rec2 family competence protein [Chloroflexota bacterium]
MPSLTLVWISIAWVTGTYLGSYVAPPWFFLPAVLLPLTPAIILSKSKRPSFILAALSLIALVGAMSRTSAYSAAATDQTVVAYKERGEVSVRGTVSDDPETRPSALLLHLSAQEVLDSGEWLPASGGILIRLRPYRDFRYGDRLEITGVLRSPEKYGDFDYPAYLARKSISSIMLYPRIRVIGYGGAVPSGWAHALRDRLSGSLASSLPQPQAAIAQAIMLGKRDGIPAALNQAFSHTGTMHLLAISGMNLSIVAGMLVAMGVWLLGRRRFIYVWFAMAGVWAYALLTGLDPPVLRAAIMASLFLLATYLGRQDSAVTSLCLAAAVMVGVQPFVLWSASFQLSFMAMAGLIFLTPLFRNLLERRAEPLLSSRRGLVSGISGLVVSSLAVTLGATMAVWPLVSYYFGIVPVVALPASLLLVPLMPVLIFTNGLTAAAGLASAALSGAAGWTAWLSISYVLKVVEVFDGLPMASLGWAMPPWAAAVYYFLVATMTWMASSSRWAIGAGSPRAAAGTTHFSGAIEPAVRIARWSVIPLLAACFLAWSAFLSLPDGKLHVKLVDSGGVESVFISTPAGHHVVIDGGPDGQALARELGSLLPFWKRTIDLMILTDPRANRSTGQIHILDTYHVKQILSPASTYDSATYREWHRLIGRKGIQRTTASAGQRLDLGHGVMLSVLHPASGATLSGEDIGTLRTVLRLDWGKVSLLLMGDTSEETGLFLLEHRADVRSTVVLIGKPGADTPGLERFLAIAGPAAVVTGQEGTSGVSVLQPIDGSIVMTGQGNRVMVTIDAQDVRVETSE